MPLNASPLLPLTAADTVNKLSSDFSGSHKSQVQFILIFVAPFLQATICVNSLLCVHVFSSTSYVFFQFVISFICINNRLMSGVAATPFSISLHVSLSFTINKYNICLYINLSSSDLLCDVAHLMEAKLPHDATMVMASTIFMRCYMIASCT